MTTFLFSLAALGAALWLRDLAIAGRPALMPVRVRRGSFRPAKS
jgi:hypothetical protein